MQPVPFKLLHVRQACHPFAVGRPLEVYPIVPVRRPAAVAVAFAHVYRCYAAKVEKISAPDAWVVLLMCACVRVEEGGGRTRNAIKKRLKARYYVWLRLQQVGPPKTHMVLRHATPPNSTAHQSKAQQEKAHPGT